MDWRSELRKKLQKHARNRGIQTRSPEEKRRRPQARRTTGTSPPPDAALKTAPSAPSKGAGGGAAAPPKEAGEVERELFKYRLEDVEKSPVDRKIVTFAKARPYPPPLDRPLIRKPVKVQAASKAGPGPEQKTLSLETEPGGAPPETTPEEPPEPSEAIPEPELSHEILFSRLLAWIIDSMISAAAGFLLVLLGSLAVGAAFPTNETLLLAGGCGLIFLLLNSVFFLFATGQTPGMAVTDLQLVGPSGEAPRLRSVLLRTVLFFPVAATGVGLLWALFDPAKRCWHDRLSQTRVVPSA